ncbi:hypothetical protein [Mucilaginibacter sp.]|uniref:hypothetical protein n=1 Tax=Mucilaginibacter sp. TaxID=1882438 RepID=UPI0035BC619D
MESRVAVADEQGVLRGLKQPFGLRVTKDKKPVMGQNTAVIEVTLYQESGSFIPQCSYLFEAVDAAGQSLAYVDVNEFKRAVDDHCTEVLGTVLYVKSIPRASSLCPKELQAFDF